MADDAALVAAQGGIGVENPNTNAEVDRVAVLKRIPAFCGRDVVDAVRHGTLSIHSALVLSYVVEHREPTTGVVARLIPINNRTRPGHTAHIRQVLLSLERKGFVEHNLRNRTTRWGPTAAATN